MTTMKKTLEDLTPNYAFIPGDFVRCLRSEKRGIRAGQVMEVLDVSSGGHYIKVANSLSLFGIDWMPARDFEPVVRPRRRTPTS